MSASKHYSRHLNSVVQYEEAAGKLNRITSFKRSIDFEIRFLMDKCFCNMKPTRCFDIFKASVVSYNFTNDFIHFFMFSVIIFTAMQWEKDGIYQMSHIHYEHFILCLQSLIIWALFFIFTSLGNKLKIIFGISFLDGLVSNSI